MNELCSQISSSAFFTGLWDGVTVPISLVLSIFFDVRFYDHCSQSWWYNCGFTIGTAAAMCLGVYRADVAVAIFGIGLVAFIIWLVFASAVYIGAFIVICVAIVWLKNRYDNRNRYFQRDGSEVIPPR